MVPPFAFHKRSVIIEYFETFRLSFRDYRYRSLVASHAKSTVHVAHLNAVVVVTLKRSSMCQTTCGIY